MHHLSALLLGQCAPPTRPRLIPRACLIAVQRLASLASPTSHMSRHVFLPALPCLYCVLTPDFHRAFCNCISSSKRFVIVPARETPFWGWGGGSLLTPCADLLPKVNFVPRSGTSVPARLCSIPGTRNVGKKNVPLDLDRPRRRRPDVEALSLAIRPCTCRIITTGRPQSRFITSYRIDETRKRSRNARALCCLCDTLPWPAHHSAHHLSWPPAGSVCCSVTRCRCPRPNPVGGRPRTTSPPPQSSSSSSRPFPPLN